MTTLVWIVILIALLIAAFGLVQWVRSQIATTREDLKHVDRSKLKDMDNDAWAKDARDKNNPRGK